MTRAATPAANAINSFPPLIAGDPPLLVVLAEADGLVALVPPALPDGVPTVAVADADADPEPVAEPVPVTTGPVSERVSVVEEPVIVAFDGND